MKVKIAKWGNSLGLRLPKHLAQENLVSGLARPSNWSEMGRGSLRKLRRSNAFHTIGLKTSLPKWTRLDRRINRRQWTGDLMLAPRSSTTLIRAAKLPWTIS